MRTFGITLLTMTVLCAGLLAADPEGKKVVAEEAVTLTTGRRVVLYEDKTWTFKVADEPNEILFRGVPWGASKETVKKAMETPPAFAADDFIVWDDEIAGLDAHRVFLFAGEQFVRGKYLFYNEHINNNEYVDEFRAINGLLIEKYGEPEKDEQVWSNDLFRGDPSRLGTAISTGGLSFYTAWRKGPVSIWHALSGDNLKVTHQIEYTHKDMQALEDAIRKQQDKDDVGYFSHIFLGRE